jgi:ketosteroid isomerase-like protein
MKRKLVAAVLLAALTISGATQVRAAAEDEVKALFRQFIDAQNAHDLNAVGDILQDSPQFLWITRNAPVWGRDAALKQFDAFYQGTWLLEPQLDQVKVSELSPGVAQLFVPAVFTIAPASQPVQPRRFLLTQTYAKTPHGWKLASIIPIAVP